MNGKQSRVQRLFVPLLIILVVPGLACGVLSRAEEIQEQVQEEVPEIVEQAVEQGQDQPAAVDSQADDAPAESQVDDDSRAPISGALRPGGVVDAVRVSVTSKNLDTGDTSVSTAAFVQPDSYLLADDSMDVIIVDGKSYSRNEAGEYEETIDMSFGVVTLVTNLIDPWGTEVGLTMATLSQSEDAPQDLGEEIVRGVTTRVYEYLIPLPEAVSAEPVRYRVWIGVGDELAYRQEIEHPGEGTLSTIEYEYEGVEIVAPGQS